MYSQQRKHVYFSKQGWLLELWSPNFFDIEPRAQSLFLLGAQTKRLILAKWSHRAPIFAALEPWSPAFFTPEPWSPEPL